MARALVREIKDTRKNYLINGDMRIAQRGTSFAAIGTGVYSLDRMIYNKVGAMVHTVSQDTDVPTVAQANYLYQNSLRLNLTTPDTAIAAGDFTQIGQHVEGYNWANMAQKPFTLSFWVKATLVGTYCVSFINSGSDRSYVAEYTINTTNTWEYKTITVSASPTAGTWDYSTGVGLRVRWALATGTTFQTTANTWQTGNFFATSNQVNGTNTGATDFRLTGIVLNEGSAALPFTLFGQDFAGEVRACQRYYEKSYDLTTPPATTGVAGWRATATHTGNPQWDTPYKVYKRATPVPTFYNSNSGATTTYRDESASADIAVSSTKNRQSGFTTHFLTATEGRQYAGDWTADAEL